MHNWKQPLILIMVMLAFAIGLTIAIIKAIKHFNKRD
jgi:hypothetical protein